RGGAAGDEALRVLRRGAGDEADILLLQPLLGHGAEFLRDAAPGGRRGFAAPLHAFTTRTRTVPGLRSTGAAVRFHAVTVTMSCAPTCARKTTPEVESE